MQRVCYDLPVLWPQKNHHVYILLDEMSSANDSFKGFFVPTNNQQQPISYVCQYVLSINTKKNNLLLWSLNPIYTLCWKLTCYSAISNWNCLSLYLIYFFITFTSTCKKFYGWIANIGQFSIYSYIHTYWYYLIYFIYQSQIG